MSLAGWALPGDFRTSMREKPSLPFVEAANEGIAWVVYHVNTVKRREAKLANR